MLSVEKIVVGELSTNCYLVFNSNKDSVVIDPGAQGEVISEKIESLGLNVISILLTHAHFDHIGAVGYLVSKYNCDVILHKNDVALLKDRDLNLSERFTNKSIDFCGKYKAVTEQKLVLLGKTFEFLHTPGHTPGSVCILVDDMLFTGDTLFYMSIGNAFSPYGSVNQELKSIKNKLFTINRDLICYTGHGNQTSLFFEKSYNPYFK